MSKLRIEQQKNEGADLFAIRAFAKAIPLMPDNGLLAAARWIWERTMAEIKHRQSAAEDSSKEKS